MTYDTINDARTIAGNAEGTLLAGRYRIVRQLGQGGMGSVWLAEDMQLDNKPFAIKMLPAVLVANKRAYRQLKDEALVAMRLVHPNIVQIRAFEENDGNPFLVMDYVDGQTLDDYLADYNSRVEHVERVEMSGAGRDARPFGGLPEADVLRILRPIAAALDYAHGEGVVHRDVKPANVMIRKDGHPFILDFGISREIQETMTRVTGKLSSGTLLYMSPEQLNGEQPRPAQDIYSFAAMVYECLKGEPPFVRGAIEDQIKNKQPEPPPGGTQLVASVMSGLAKKPEERPPTCSAVLEGNGLSRVEHAERVDGAAGSRVPRDRTGGSRSRATAILVAAALALTVAGGWWYYRQEQAREQARIAVEAARQKAAAEEAKRKAEEAERQKALAELARQKEEAELIAKASATEIRIEARVQQSAVRNISDEDGFRAKKDDLSKVFAQADALFDDKVKRWSDAAVLFTNYVAGCKALLTQDGERQTALSARVKANESKRGAELADARRYVSKHFEESVKLFDNAADEFSSGQFANANSSFLRVARQFDRCAEEANAERSRLAAEAREKAEREAAERRRQEAAAAKAQAEKEVRERRGAEERANATYSQRPKHGDTKTLTLPGGATMEMIYVAPGSFAMGFPSDDDEYFFFNAQHQVILTKGFWLGKYEVTQAQWQSVMGENPSRFKGANNPVENVSWEDCQIFISKINSQQNYEVRLPTEAEWEYACRAGSTGAYGGNGDLNDMGWYYGNSNRKTHPVGQKQANAWGFFDMHGNVEEWCNDWCERYSGNATDPKGPPSGGARVLRGGSYTLRAQFCLSAERSNGEPGERGYTGRGLRLACSAGLRQ